MSKERRRRLESLLGQIETLAGSVEDILAEEETARDNFPENLLSSETTESCDVLC